MFFRLVVEHRLSKINSKLKDKIFFLKYNNKACEFIDVMEKHIIPSIEEVFGGGFLESGKIVIRLSFTLDELTEEKFYEYSQSVKQFVKRYNKSIKDFGRFGYSPNFASYLCFDFVLNFLESSLNHIYAKMIKEFEKIDLVI